MLGVDAPDFGKSRVNPIKTDGSLAGIAYHGNNRQLWPMTEADIADYMLPKVPDISVKSPTYYVKAAGVENATLSISSAPSDYWTLSVIPDGTVVTSATASNNGTIQYTVAPNTGAARQGNIRLSLYIKGTSIQVSTYLCYVDQLAPEYY